MDKDQPLIMPEPGANDAKIAAHYDEVMALLKSCSGTVRYGGEEYKVEDFGDDPRVKTDLLEMHRKTEALIAAWQKGED